MKRILTVLVLLVTVSVVGGVANVPAAYADEPGAIAVPQDDVKAGDLDGTLSGPDGDPDGMGTGNGVDGRIDPVMRSAGELDGISEVEALLRLLSLIHLLAI